MRSVCVFCGSSGAVRDEYLTSASALGTELADRGLTTVYGGASVGLMGRVADAALAAGGRVVGIMPRTLLEREVQHRGLTELVETDSLAERKNIMADRSDAFVCLPGGGGTLDELFEVFTWFQLGLHSKPIGLIDTLGYWTQLLNFLDTSVDQGFIAQHHRDALLVRDTAQEMLDAIIGSAAGSEN